MSKTPPYLDAANLARNECQPLPSRSQHFFRSCSLHGLPWLASQPQARRLLSGLRGVTMHSGARNFNSLVDVKTGHDRRL
ncbi:hypothetical protein [Neorhodopirellula lusitana]|uniref:hypothetical protein n=1 Tax=Neorhodopirellula lusitana TaxID=445327 RepID=UPI00384CBEAE